MRLEEILKVENMKLDARSLYIFLEIGRDFSTWIKDRLSYGFVENKDYYILKYNSNKEIKHNNKQGGDRKSKNYIITLDVAKNICRIERRNKRASMALKYFLSYEDKEVIIIEPQRKELEFIDALEKQLSVFNIEFGKQQYYCCNNKYRIDYYIPSLNIAIEYDENNHNNYTYDKHEGRQIEIEKELGCKFIRVSDKENNYYNCAYILKEIMIATKKIS